VGGNGETLDAAKRGIVGRRCGDKILRYVH
jgi:hypothetical protein